VDRAAVSSTGASRRHADDVGFDKLIYPDGYRIELIDRSGN
jgi:hypothetical protein